MKNIEHKKSDMDGDAMILPTRWCPVCLRKRCRQWWVHLQKSILGIDMENMKSLLGEYKKEDKSVVKTTERGELFKYFITRINPGRIKAGYPPFSYARMGKLLEGIPTKDLYYLQRVCNDSTNFSKRFFWELNPKKHTS